MELLLLLFAGGIAFLIWFVTIIRNPNQKFRPAPKSTKQLKAEADHIAELERSTALAVLLGQSKFVGDESTYQSVINHKYEGPLPEKQDNGSWTSPYPQLLALPIAGINYRTNVSKCTRPGRARLVADPKNEYDPNAIKVIHESGTHLGFIPSDRTGDISDLIPCYAMCDITEEQDELDHARHYFRGWIYINTKTTHTDQSDVPNK